ncbi:hypothetical protein BJX64DRAFT_252327 [Aspergillus heterothallicus]
MTCNGRKNLNKNDFEREEALGDLYREGEAPRGDSNLFTPFPPHPLNGPRPCVSTSAGEAEGNVLWGEMGWFLSSDELLHNQRDAGGIGGRLSAPTLCHSQPSPRSRPTAHSLSGQQLPFRLVSSWSRRRFDLGTVCLRWRGGFGPSHRYGLPMTLTIRSFWSTLLGYGQN